MKNANVIYYVPIYVFYTKLYEYFQTISNEIIYRHVDEILKEDPNKNLTRTAICKNLEHWKRCWVQKSEEIESINSLKTRR